MVRQKTAAVLGSALNAPLPQVPTRTVGWTEAKDTVLTAYGAFSPKMAAIAKRFFDERWIDAPVRPGKAPGLGLQPHPTTPSAHPYVLLNYRQGQAARRDDASRTSLATAYTRCWRRLTAR